jgi:hypothetical protein
MRGRGRVREDRSIEDAGPDPTARRPPEHGHGEELGMTTMHPERAERRRHHGKPAVGRPMLFAVLLLIAAAGTLGLLVAGPSLALPLAIASAAALIVLVATAWVVAGPRF